MNFLSKQSVLFVAIMGALTAHADPIFFEVTADDCAGVGIRLDRPFSTICTFSNLPALVGENVTLFIQAVGDIGGIDEILEVDADGFPLILLGAGATVMQEFGSNTVELFDQIVSDVFLPTAIGDGSLVLTTTASQAFANVTINELGLRYFSPAVSVPVPSTLTLFTLGLLGIG